jgi:hypothetical protein
MKFEALFVDMKLGVTYLLLDYFHCTTAIAKGTDCSAPDPVPPMYLLQTCKTKGNTKQKRIFMSENEYVKRKACSPRTSPSLFDEGP